MIKFSVPGRPVPKSRPRSGQVLPASRRQGYGKPEDEGGACTIERFRGFRRDPGVAGLFALMDTLMF